MAQILLLFGKIGTHVRIDSLFNSKPIRSFFLFDIGLSLHLLLLPSFFFTLQCCISITFCSYFARNC